MDLVTFLRERLDEDEAAAAATDGATEGTRRWQTREDPTEGLPDHVDVTVEAGEDWWIVECCTGSLADRRAVAEHIARHEPARVLREVAAKRARLEAWQNARRQLDRRPDSVTAGVYGIHGWLLRIDAAVYADHPDYDKEWTP